MSKKRFILVVVLSFFIIAGVYSLCSFTLFPHTPPLIKLILGIVVLFAMIVNLINIYKAKVK
jgi:hypothetical protein